MRSNKVVAPLSVFKGFNGGNYGKDYISVGDFCVKFNVGDSKFAVNGIEKDFEISPFEYLPVLHAHFPSEDYPKLYLRTIHYSEALQIPDLLRFQYRNP